MNETWQILGEVWDSFSGWEKGGLIATGVIAVLGTLASLEEERSWEGLPTEPQVEGSRQTIKKLEKELNDLKGSTVSGESASQWEAQTGENLKTIEEYRHTLFAPGEVTKIRNALEDARRFRREGSESLAAKTFYDAWQLSRITLAQVLQEEKRWEEANAVYLTCHKSLEEVLETTPKMEVRFTTDQGQETLTMDADFWSRGQVTVLQTQMPQPLLSRDLTVEQVQQQTRTLQNLAEDLSRVVTEAVDAFRMSQQRMELCEAVYDSLADRGWCLEDTGENGFEQEDPRQDACLNLYNAAGDRLRLRFSGPGQIAAQTRFRGVYNRNLEAYLQGVLRQALEENGFVVAQLTAGT